MTPDELKQWREAMGWTLVQAAAMLGIGLRAYNYLEEGVTSGGNPRQTIPRVVELAAAEIMRTKPTPPPDGRRGRPVSKKTREKIGEAQRKRWQRVKRQP